MGFLLKLGVVFGGVLPYYVGTLHNEPHTGGRMHASRQVWHGECEEPHTVSFEVIREYGRTVVDLQEVHRGCECDTRTDDELLDVAYEEGL